MPTLEEILGIDSTTDVLVVDQDLRTIKIPSTVKNIGVESDDDVLRLKFAIPRYYGEFDLSEFDIRINYLNARSEGDVYEVNDAVMIDGTSTEDAHITFTWLVGRFAVMYKGLVTFNICLKKIENGLVVREFNTAPATLPVLQGLETMEQITQEYPDLLESWREYLFSARETDMSAIETAVQKGKEDIEDAVDVAIQTASGRLDYILKNKDGNLVGSREGGLDLIEIQGASEQLSTEGNQLLDIYDSVKSANGLTATVDELGFIHISGTPTAPYTVVAFKEVDLLPGDYRINGGQNRPGWAFAQVNLTHADGSAQYITNSSFTVVDGDRVTVAIQSGSSLDPINAVVRPMLNAGTYTMMFEPYTGGKASPSLEYRQEIKNAGANGSLEVTTIGTNWIDIPNGTYQEMAVAECDLEPGWYHYEASSFESTSGDVNKDPIFHFYSIALYTNEDDDVMEPIYVTQVPFISNAYSFDLQGHAKKMIIFAGDSPTSSIGHSLTISGVLVERVDQDETGISYITPYRSDSITIPLAEPLREFDKIVEQDGLWGVLRGTAQKVFGGTWQFRDAFIPIDGSLCYSSGDFITDNYKSTDGNMYMACDRLLFGGGVSAGSDISKIGEKGFFYKIAVNATGSGTGTTMYIPSDAPTLADFLAEMEGAIFEYRLAEPVFEPFDIDTQIAINGLKTYGGGTRITTSSEVKPVFVVKYGVSDTAALTIAIHNSCKTNDILRKELADKTAELDAALPFAIEIDDSAKTINFIDRK